MRVNIFQNLNNHLEMSKYEKEMWTFVTPFSPEYGSKYTKGLLKKSVDYSHEREWRTQNSLSFDYSDIAFVILKNIEDYNDIPDDIKAEFVKVGTKIIIMDNYRLVEQLWPVHKISQPKKKKKK